HRCFVSLIPIPLRSSHFPYTTLFRSPEFSGKTQDTYIEGYVPNSLSAPHSSLQRTSTWLGMGLMMGTVPPAGILIWALSVIVERSEEHTSELQSRFDLVCRLLLEKKK